MPHLITMRAMVAFDRNGKHLNAGDEFSAYPIEAASLNYNRKAEFVKPRPQALTSRSMQAEPRPPARPAPAPDAPQQQSGGSSETTDGSHGRRTGASGGRGNYRRRDMAVPEDKG